MIHMVHDEKKSRYQLVKALEENSGHYYVEEGDCWIAGFDRLGSRIRGRQRNHDHPGGACPNGCVNSPA